MADVMFPKRAPTPRELDTRPVPSDYRPRRARVLAPGDVDSEIYSADEPREPNHADTTEISSQVNLHKLEQALSRNPLNEIATMMRSLTYGEMMELAQAIWKIRPEGEGIDQDSLPMMLHRWSTSTEH